MNVCSDGDGMVINFLIEYQNSLIKEKSELETEQKNCNVRISEIIQFIEQLREEDDFDALSPRKQNSDIQKKIFELEKEQNCFFKKSEKIKQRLQDIDSKLDELESVLNVARNENEDREKQINGILEKDDIFKLKMLEIQEKERQRIARDLHDSSVQNMVSMVHKIELCSKLVDIDPIRCRLELVNMSKVIKEVIEEMRQMIYNLRPMSFDDIGFDVTLERELTRIQNLGINTNYTIEGEKYKVNPVVSLTLLRVIQEACNNAVKHANATMISVHIQYEEDKICAIVHDNGKGFKVDKCKLESIREDNSGFGLSTMHERVCLLSGKLVIHSELGVGTEIIIEVPRKKEEI